MSADTLWAAPLLLLPGVALMVLSTSTRFGLLHDEFHRVLETSRNKRDVKNALDGVCHRDCRNRFWQHGRGPEWGREGRLAIGIIWSNRGHYNLA